MTLPNPDAQNQQSAGNDQTDYKSEYIKLSAQIASGDYVAKNVYTGLQQTHEKTVLAHKADKDALAAAQQKATGLEQALSTLQTQSEEIKTKLTTTESEKGTLDAQLQRTKLIMGKFPHLAPFEADGLLPLAPIAELEGVLTAFSSKLGNTAQQALQEHVAGATNPPPSGNQAPLTSAQLLQKANAFASKGQWAEYNTAYDEYVAQLTKESKPA